MRKKWNVAELDFLKEHYDNITDEDASKLLNRSTKAVCKKRIKLNFFKDRKKSHYRSFKKNERIWKREEIDFLVNNINKLNFKEMAKQMGRSISAIQTKSLDLRLKVDKEFICKQRNGFGNPFFGKHHSEKSKQKIREHHLKNRSFFSNKMKLNNPMKNPEVVKKVSAALKGKPSFIKNKKWDEYYGLDKARKIREKQTISRKGKHYSPLTEFTKQKAAEMRKDPEMLKKMLKKSNVFPNKPEKIMISLLKNNNLPYTYVGNGELVIGGKVPDFANCNGQKKLIEVFGDYWHNPDIKNDVKWHQTEEGTRVVYSKLGFKVLIVWEHELENLDEVLEKVRRFDNE